MEQPEPETDLKAQRAREHILARSADGEVVQVRFADAPPPRLRLLNALFADADAPKRGLRALLAKEGEWHQRTNCHGQDVCWKRLRLEPLGIGFEEFLSLWENVSQEFHFSGRAQMQRCEPTIVEVEVPRFALEQAKQAMRKWSPPAEGQAR